MKLIKTLLFILIGASILIACSPQDGSPTDTVSKFMESYVNGNAEDMKKYSLRKKQISLTQEYGQYFEGIDISSDSYDFVTDFYENDLIPVIAAKTKYKIKKASIDGNSANVTVTLEVPGMSEVIKKIMLNEQILSMGESDMHRLFVNEISESKNIKLEQDFELSFTAGEWLIDFNQFDVMNALSGGLFLEYQNIYQAALDEFKQSIEEAADSES